MKPENMEWGEVVGYSVMFLSMLSVFFGIRHYRKTLPGGGLTFGKGVATGLMITAVATVIFYFANVILYELIVPNFLEDFFAYYKNYMLEQAQNQAERAEIKATYSENSLMKNSWFYALMMAGTVLPMGIIISLLSAAILKRKSATPKTR